MRTALLLCSLLSTVFGLADMGMPGWSCSANLMKKSQSVPKSVHSLRPADIQIVGALGDSMTAGNGAGAPQDDILGVAVQYRGLTFSVGGDNSLDEHITMANVLKKFNPDLFGYSVRTGKANTAKLNGGIPGAHSTLMAQEANDLVQKLKDHPDIDYKNQWKLIHIFIGANDMCAWCDHQDSETADNYRDNIRAAVQILQRELPKTIVVLTGMIDVGLLRNVDKEQQHCHIFHDVECLCERAPKVTDEMLANEAKLYAQKEQELQDSGEFDTADDFTLIIQPFFEGVTDVARNMIAMEFVLDHLHLVITVILILAFILVFVLLFVLLCNMLSATTESPRPNLPENAPRPVSNNRRQPDGTVNMDFFAPDCFHFSQYGHAITAKNLWNNMMQPVGSKTTANFTDTGYPLLCPEPSCPFIRTTKNSQDCGKYMTA